MKAAPLAILWLCALVGLVGSCTPPESASTVTIGPRSTEPEMLVGLGTGLSRVTLGGGAALIVSSLDGVPRAEVPAGAQLIASGAGGGLQFTGALSWSPAAGDSLAFSAAAPDGFVRVGGREYRGALLLFRGSGGLTVVNRVSLESYLAGVVSAEMGRRDSSEVEAVKAQAVISRTYAMRNRGRWRAQGFDLQATVADQVYGGVAAETPLGWQAVLGTAGQILTFDGAPIDGFFFSTCGGQTAKGTEVFSGAERPYLVSMADTDAAGQAYCRISPRFNWRQEWSGEALRDILRESVPAALGPTIAARAVVQSVRVREVSPSGRVARLVLAIDGRELTASGAAVRQVLRPARGELLRSSMFTLSELSARGSVTRLVADGHGAGHGVGLCQWGAVGRAREGQRYSAILAAYYPHTDLERLY